MYYENTFCEAKDKMASVFKFSDEVYPQIRYTPPVFKTTCPHVEFGPLFFRQGVRSSVF